MADTWEHFIETFNSIYHGTQFPDDSYLNTYFVQGIERIRVREIRQGRGDTVILLGFNPDEKKPSNAITFLSSLTLIFKVERKAEFDEQPEPVKFTKAFNIGLDHSVGHPQWPVSSGNNTEAPESQGPGEIGP